MQRKVKAKKTPSVKSGEKLHEASMEEDETTMSIEEFRTLIRAKLKNSRLLPPDVLQKCDELQSLLDRRQKMDATLLKLQQSVAACEAIVRRQYSMLGWEYRDTDSDTDQSSGGDSGRVPPSCKSDQAGTPAGLSPAGLTPLLPKQRGSEKLHRSRKRFRMREPVVVLTRLPEWQIRGLRRPAPPTATSEDKSLSRSGSDPERESSDSDLKRNNSGGGKRRKVEVSEKKLDERDQACTETETSNPKFVEKTEESPPPANIKGVNSGRMVTSCQSPDGAPKDPPRAPHTELRVNMKVLARRRPMIWQPGTIKKILQKDDGRLKYKVNFVKKGKILVSAHHIASEQAPSAEQLFVGTRVVVKADQDSYSPGVVIELPCCTNHMRFLVFIDNHTPIYVHLAGIHLLCRPLSNPLGDIPNGAHKDFMEAYLKSWPHPPKIRNFKGEIIEVEHNGVQKKCEVEMVDCSLILVVFQEDQRKEWIYRGSMRLKRMAAMRKQLEWEKEKSNQCTTNNHK